MGDNAQRRCSVLLRAVSVNSVVAFRLRKQELERDEPGFQRGQLGALPSSLRRVLMIDNGGDDCAGRRQA